MVCRRRRCPGRTWRGDGDGLEGVRGRAGAGPREDEGVRNGGGVQARGGGGPGAREGKEAGAAEGGAGSAEVNK